MLKTEDVFRLLLELMHLNVDKVVFILYLLVVGCINNVVSLSPCDTTTFVLDNLL